MKRLLKTLKEWNWRRIIGVILFITLVLSIAYVLINIIRLPAVAPDNDPTADVKSDYFLMLLQCSLALLVMFLPSVLQRKLSLDIPNYMFVMYFVFLYCAVYLGEVHHFYFVVPNWDVYLHMFSGAMLGALGFSLISILNEEERVNMHLSPFFIAFFAFCFALACSVVWEIYEFVVDSVAALNMQKYALEDGTLLIGRAALLDTMEDMIVALIGSLIVCVWGFVNLKRKRKTNKPNDTASTEATSAGEIKQ